MKYITSFEEILQVMIILLLRERSHWRSTRMLVSANFKQLRTFVVVLDVLSKFSKIENVFSFK